MLTISSDRFAKSTPYTHTPQYIQFYPTLKCDLSCNFCFNRGIKSKTHIPLNDFERFVSIALEIGVREIDILGGEPTLHPEFISMINILSTRNMKTTISSNGSNIYPLKELSRKYDSDRILIGVSLNSDSLHSELHDYIVQYKPFVKSVCLRERIIPEAARDYLTLPGVKYYFLYMDTLCKDDLLRSLPFYEFYTTIQVLKNIYENIDGVFCSGFLPDRERYPVLQYVRCPAVTTKLSVLPDGSVYPCYLFFRHEGFRLGNIVSDDFERIWKNPVLDFFREYKGNTCPERSCKLFSSCHGGCPAVSHLIYGDINAPDPRCVSPSSS